MKLALRLICLLLASLLAPSLVVAQSQSDAELAKRRAEERLTFQSGDPWTPRINVNADAAMVYGIGPKLPGLVNSWRDHGYIVDLMTGVAWGGYQDYLDGKFDGTNHWDQAQTDVDGKHIIHGGNPMVPYMSPGEDYGRYLSTGVKRALDQGVEAVYLEEPEFWARSGWEDNFKREWKAYYREDWQSPDSSPDAQYRASKLKYFLYRRALAQVFDFVSAYGKEHGRTIPCYVATHSLINYANWRIVSPESSPIGVGAQGYIAQVWTGTARTPNVYNGERKERTFETAFLEYGVMQNLVRASGRRIWYLNDPVADSPNNTWDDYRTHWQSTLTASLLMPEVSSYEIMPWPQRVFNGVHPATEEDAEKLRRGSSVVPTGASGGAPAPKITVPMKGIPKEYEIELQTVIAALGNMKQADVRWQVAGTRRVGVLVSDTMMFERADPHPSDQYLGSFYGLALPLVTRGIPVEPVQIESSTAPGFLSRYRLLFLTYEGQKPPAPTFHLALAAWVRGGGALVVVDNDDDPYNAVREWWNTAPNAFTTPRQHLFVKLGIPADASGLFHVGRGVVLAERVSPAALSYESDGGNTVRGFARQAAAAIHLPWSESNALVLRRGPYVIAAGLDDSIPNAAPVSLHGRFIDLFDANLPILPSITLAPGVRDLLFDLTYAAGTTPRVAAAACAVRNIRATPHQLSFTATGIADTTAAVRIQSRLKPTQVAIAGQTLPSSAYQVEDGTILLHFANSVEPVSIDIRFE
ncbi:MAG TPA: hypothetical protein VJX73_09765 [Terracidiphilus sp.]|nr:hypothetical protein [Terracidiphilus sp.]